VKEQVELWVQDLNLAKLNQTRASIKQQTSEQAPRGPTATAGPQFCKVEANNNKQHPLNQRTGEQATTNELVMLVDNNISHIHSIQDCIQKLEENVL
jgi:hypothetical protein